MKIIVYDIETAPILVTSWGLRKPYLTHDNIVRDASILTAAWKVFGRGNRVQAIWVDPKDPTDDKELVKNLRSALCDADILVAQNGDRFDLPWIQSRILFHRLQPLPPIRTVDTLKIARSKFRFTSNRLDYLGKYLGLGCKIKTDYDLWMDILFGGPAKAKASLAKMVRYNKQDVLLLEKVYERLRPYMTSHPNLRLMEARMKCPVCGKGKLVGAGRRYNKKTVVQRWHCLNPKCGHYPSGKVIGRTDIA